MIAPITAAARPSATPAVPRAAFMRGLRSIGGHAGRGWPPCTPRCASRGCGRSSKTSPCHLPSSTTGMPSLNSSGGLALVLHRHGDAVERHVEVDGRRPCRARCPARPALQRGTAWSSSDASRATASSALRKYRVALLRPWKSMKADRGEQDGEHDAHDRSCAARRRRPPPRRGGDRASGPPGPVRGVRSTSCPHREAASRATGPA